MKHFDALAKYLTDNYDIDPEDISYEGEGPYGHGETYVVDGVEIHVFDDEEEHDALQEYAENYVEDCMLPEIPEGLARQFFDVDAAIDAVKGDGIGHCLNSWDGSSEDTDCGLTVLICGEL